MRTTSSQTPAEARDGKKEGLRRYAPLLSGIALTGALLISPAFGRAEAEAGPAPKRECTASVKSGTIDALSAPAKDKAKGVELKVLLPAKGKYLLVTLPPDYLSDLGKAAEGKPEGQREAFGKAAVAANIGLGYDKASGKSTPVKFDCAPLAEVAVKPEAAPEAKPRSMKIDPDADKKPAPVPSATPKKEQPKPEQPKKDEAKPPAPVPTQEPPSEKKRTLKISDTKAELQSPEAAPASTARYVYKYLLFIGENDAYQVVSNTDLPYGSLDADTAYKQKLVLDMLKENGRFVAIPVTYNLTVKALADNTLFNKDKIKEMWEGIKKKNPDRILEEVRNPVPDALGSGKTIKFYLYEEIVNG